MSKKSVRVLISGRVQGVFFRASTCDMAQELGLQGWVKNDSDGGVTAFFQGEEELVDKAIEWCRHGPPSAMVTEVEIQKEAFIDELTNFKIRY